MECSVHLWNNTWGPKIQKGKGSFHQMPTLLSFHFLTFSAFLGEPSEVPDCGKVKYTTVQLGFYSRRIKSIAGEGEGQEGVEGPRRGSVGLQSPN